MKLPRLTSGTQPRHVLRFILFATATACLLLYKLGGLPGGLAPDEHKLQPAHATVHTIVHDPLYLPLQVLRLIAGYLPHSSTVVTRLPSVVAGLLLLVCFTLLVRVWYGARSAFFGFVLLATAPWFLHMSRLALNDILFPLSLTILLLFYSYWQRSESLRWFWLSPLINGLLLYTPGFVWIVVIGIIWQWPEYKGAWQKTGLLPRLGWLLLWPLTAVLLGYACWRSPLILYAWGGLPEHLITPLHIARNVGNIWVRIFVRGPQQPLIGLGYLPLINVFTTSMAFIGSYFYVSHWRAARSRVLLTIALIGTVLASLDGPVSSSILLPLIFLLAAGGIGFLLHEWLKVFPRNPLAKAAGYTFLGLTLAFAVFYNVHQYFDAWPHNTTTRIAFSQHR